MDELKQKKRKKIYKPTKNKRWIRSKKGQTEGKNDK